MINEDNVNTSVDGGEDTGVDTQEAVDNTVVNEDVKKADVETKKSAIEKPTSGKEINDFYNPKEVKVVKDEKVVEPQTYEFKKIDGLDLAEDVLGKVKSFSATNNLKPDEAQKILDITADVVNSERNKTQGMILDRVKAWHELSLQDEEIGGVNVVEKMSSVKSFIKKFGNDNTMNVLRESGLASHPEVLRMLYRASKAISEDNFIIDQKIQANSKPTPKKNIFGETMIVFDDMLKN